MNVIINNEIVTYDIRVNVNASEQGELQEIGKKAVDALNCTDQGWGELKLTDDQLLLLSQLLQSI